MKCLLFILIISFVNVDCGLLKDALTPVTESIQNNDLLDEHERKDKEPKNKGLVTKVVETLDSAGDSLTNILGQGKKAKGVDKTDSTPKYDVKTDSYKTDEKIPDNISKNDTEISNNNLEEGNKSNNIQVELHKEENAKENDLAPSTLADFPTTTEACKGETCNTPAVVQRVNFDGSQCPTGQERAHDDTCKDIQ